MTRLQEVQFVGLAGGDSDGDESNKRHAAKKFPRIEKWYGLFFDDWDKWVAENPRK
jgi:hypothetical protein